MSLENLVSYESPHHPFVDCYGAFSLSFSGPATVGPQWLHPRGVLSTYQLLNPAIKLWSRGAAGTWSSARRIRLTSWPWMTEEHGTLDGLDVVARYAFVDHRTILAEFAFTNCQDHSASTTPTWIGMGVPDERRYMLDYFDGASKAARELRVSVSNSPASVSVSIDPLGASDLPWVGAEISSRSPAVTAVVLDAPAWAGLPEDGKGKHFAFHAKLIELGPGETFAYTFTIRVANRHADSVQKPSAIQPTDAMIAERRRALLKRVSEQDPWLVQRAKLGLIRCGLQGDGGEFGSDTASLCTSDASDFSCSFFWDSLFSSVALAEIDSDLARGAIRTAFTRQIDRDGSTPERKWNHCVPHRMAQQSPQSPIGTWALNRFLAIHDDPSFAREMYPRLAANHRFWTTFSDTDRDGLAEYRWTGQVSDNSPLWDFYGLTDGKPAGCQWIPPVASVALNSFRHRDALELASLAGRLGLTDEASHWTTAADRIAQAMLDICHVASEHRFWDYNHHTQTHRRVRTFWMFLPLWARLPMPQSTKDSLIEALLDPAQFFGPIPFPSVAYDEPTYKPDGYWRGKTWPHVATWLVEALIENGRSHEATIAAGRLLSAWSAIGGPSENLSTDATAPHGGFPDYNWGCASVLILDRLIDRSRDPSIQRRDH